MANVCLVGLNSKYVHSCLAVYCLEAGIKEYAKEDINPIVIERTIHNDMHKVADEIMAYHPFLVGISRVSPICNRFDVKLFVFLISFTVIPYF